MSKTITIPKDRDPFVVIVNGVEYKYPAGATVTVPDSVADVIEKYENAKPKPDPNPAPGGSVQSDWNQNDSSAADFIKNKPFGEGRGYIMPEQEVCDPSGEGAHVSLDEEINVGDTVTVVYDGVSYDCTALDYPDLSEGRLFGNLSLMGMEDDTGEPFIAVSTGNVGKFFIPDADSHVIGIIAERVNKLAPEYMEVLTFYVNGSNTDPYIYTDATLNNKATKEEILAASKIQNFRLEISTMGFTSFATPVISVPIYKQTPFKVYAFDCINEEIRIYRTAEYTPEA